MENITKKVKIDHMLLHMAYQCMCGIVFGFSVYMLIERGFSSSAAGVCMALCNGISVVLQSIISNYLDENQKYTVYDVVLFLAILMFSFYLSCSLIRSNAILIAVTFCLGVGIYCTLDAFINSMTQDFVHKGIELDFGFSRGIGTLTYGTICVVFGLLTDSHGFISVLIGGCIFCLFIVIMVLLIRGDFKYLEANKVKEVKPAGYKREVFNFGQFILNNKRFILLCIFLTGLYYSFSASDSFMILVVENVGGNSNDLGKILGFKSLLEGVGMICYTRLRKKLKLNTVLAISALSFAAKAFIVYFASDIFMLYVSQLFQATSFAFMIPAMVEYVTANMDHKMYRRGNSFAIMTLKLGQLFSSFISGFVSDNFGIQVVLLFGLVIGFMSALGFVSTLMLNISETK